MKKSYNESYGWSFNFDSLQENLIIKHLKPKKTDRILEIGCNRGVLLKKLQEKGLNVKGIDYSQEAVDNSVAKNVKQMDATKLKFDDDSFDKIFSVHTIEHVENLSKMMQEVERVLKPGGTVVFIYPSEPIQGLFVSFRALWAHKDIRAARKIHVHKLHPKKVKRFAKATRLVHAKSIWPAMLLPQFVSVFQKLL